MQEDFHAEINGQGLLGVQKELVSHRAVPFWCFCDASVVDGWKHRAFTQPRALFSRFIPLFLPPFVPPQDTRSDLLCEAPVCRSVHFGGAEAKPTEAFWSHTSCCGHGC